MRTLQYVALGALSVAALSAMAVGANAVREARGLDKYILLGLVVGFSGVIVSGIVFLFQAL